MNNGSIYIFILLNIFDSKFIGKNGLGLAYSQICTILSDELKGILFTFFSGQDKCIGWNEQINSIYITVLVIENGKIT